MTKARTAWFAKLKNSKGSTLLEDKMLHLKESIAKQCENSMKGLSALDLSQEEGTLLTNELPMEQPSI
jgi:hypothetical protein